MKNLYSFKSFVSIIIFSYIYYYCYCEHHQQQLSLNDQLIQDQPDGNDEEASNIDDAAVAAAAAAAAAVTHLIDHNNNLFNYHNNNNRHRSLSLNDDLKLLKNCSYIDNDLFCDCDLLSRTFLCYNVQSIEQIRRAFDHLLNRTRLIYWNRLEIHCIEPYLNDDHMASSTSSSSSLFFSNNFDSNGNGNASTSSSSTTTTTTTNKQSSTLPPNKSYHISYELFTDGPRFETILFVGDCSKPRHYDNLIAVDRDVQQIIMHRNMLRMSTSCSLFQPKFERLNELILKDCLVAGDMISSTFSTRCLGHYGTRNEPMQLTRLIISSCNISLIEGGAFHNFAELELIDLSWNQITHLSRQAFAPHLYRLRTLKLDHNKLTNLNGDFFEKLPELRQVLLNDNRLQTLPFLSSAGPGVAQVLQLQNNPWDCRCRLTWLLEEPMDSVRLIADEPYCETPINFQNQTLFKGLQTVKQIFC